MYFGTSVFREMAEPVADYTSIYSHFLSQQKIGSMILTAKRATGEFPRVSLPAGASESGDKLNLAQAYGSIVEGYESLEFVTGGLSTDSYFASLDRAEKRIYDAIGISPSLARRFSDSGLTVASGIALNRTYVRSAATFATIIEAFLPILSDITGSVVTWVNPLEAVMTGGDMPSEGSQDGLIN